MHVFSLAFSRQRVIQPLLEELKLQSRVGLPYREVSISGSVKAPGIYPLEPEMRISDMLRAGGQLSEEAYTLRAELARYQVVEGEYRVGEVIDVDGEVFANSIKARYRARPDDRIDHRRAVVGGNEDLVPRFELHVLQREGNSCPSASYESRVCAVQDAGNVTVSSLPGARPGQHRA